ncbi:MAG: GNAT family N-acetyltransferase [Anaerolineae bacterium]|nr:GNAT family N-acetyltransferase [Anaerolineae bacterium]
MHGETIRQLTLDDYDDLLSLWQRAGLHSIRPDGRDSREALARQLATGVMAMLGIVVEGRLVAAAIVTHDSRKGWINRLAVDPDQRRRGYGMRLVEEAEALLHERGIPVSAVLVMSHNTGSLALFQKAGYVEVDSGIHYLTKRESEDV